MRKTADVRSIDALKDAKAALIEFREVIATAISEAQTEVLRTVSWLRHDQTMYWKREHRRRSELLARAKSELFRAQLESGDSRPLATEQKKALQYAERRLEEAEQKLRAVKKWVTKLDRETLLFKGECQPIARAVELEIPKGEARLEQIIRQLESYMSVTPPRDKSRSTSRRIASPTPSADPKNAVQETDEQPTDDKQDQSRSDE